LPRSHVEGHGDLIGKAVTDGVIGGANGSEPTVRAAMTTALSECAPRSGMAMHGPQSMCGLRVSYAMAERSMVTTPPAWSSASSTGLSPGANCSPVRSFSPSPICADIV
jgi:hypothetical protein